MLEFTVGIILGIFIGTIVTAIYSHSDLIGTLNVVNTEDSEPCLLLELNDEVNTLHGKKYVMMKIRENNMAYNEKH